MHVFTAASNYIERLRDPRRRKYAREFYGFLRAKGAMPYPPHPPNLSTMAAQAVRMELLDIMEPAGYGLPDQPGDDRPEDLDPEDMPGFNPDWQDPEATPDESMDGDHASALESVYGPND